MEESFHYTKRERTVSTPLGPTLPPPTWQGERTSTCIMACSSKVHEVESAPDKHVEVVGTIGAKDADACRPACGLDVEHFHASLWHAVFLLGAVMSEGAIMLRRSSHWRGCSAIDDSITLDGSVKQRRLSKPCAPARSDGRFRRRATISDFCCEVLVVKGLSGALAQIKYFDLTAALSSVSKF